MEDDLSDFPSMHEETEESDMDMDFNKEFTLEAFKGRRKKKKVIRPKAGNPNKEFLED